MNLSNSLQKVLSPKVRLWLYVIVALTLLVFSAWQVAEGDIALFLGGLLAALVNVLAAGNVTLPDKEIEE